VHWQGSLAGSGSTQVPGPSDVLIQALVVLRPEDLTAATGSYPWQPAPAGWDSRVNEPLRPYLPAGGDWQHNPQYELDVRTERYGGTVYLDRKTGTAFLDLYSR